MKKIVCVFLALLTLIPCLAWADGPDYSSMTADELRAVIADARAALAGQVAPYADGFVIYDENDIKVTITGVRWDERNGYFYLDVTVVNRSEHKIYVKLDDDYINGWHVNDSFASTAEFSPKKNGKDSLRFVKLKEDAEVTAMEQIEDLAFHVKIVDSDQYNTLYYTDEMMISFAW